MNGVFAAECRWLARAFGGAILFFVAAHLLSGDAPDWSRASPVERALVLWFAATLAGFVVIWWRDLPGAVVSFAGGAGFCVTEWAASGDLPGGLLPLVLFTPGAFAVAAWWFDHHRVSA